MTVLSLPWAWLCVAVPLAGAVGVLLLRDPVAAWRWGVGVATAVLAASLMPWLALRAGVPPGGWFAVDELSAPMLPVVALLHLLTLASTARVELDRTAVAGLLAGEGLRLAMFAAAPTAPWILVLFLALGTLPPLVELQRRRQPTRVYVVHMGLFVALLAAGGLANEAAAGSLGSVLLLLAVLVRSGTVPVHLWVADLFDHLPFGTAMLFVTPLAGVYAALRLVLPAAPDWVLTGLGAFSLVTAVYAAGMAAVQDDARRFFAYLFLSHASLVLVGLELHTALSLTGALCLWASVALSIGGLGLGLRALEARHGRLSLAEYGGRYAQYPALAVGFLLAGLGSVGFPGTLGFVAAELLVDGAVEAAPLVGIGLTAAAALNGIAVMRAYLRLFTGRQPATTYPVAATVPERVAMLTLVGLLLVGGLAPQPAVADRHAVAVAFTAAREQPHPPTAPVSRP